MNRSILERARAFLQAHRKSKIWHRVLRSLAVIVVFITTYLLILPAITMERTATCGMEEHTHTDECYKKEEPTPEPTSSPELDDVQGKSGGSIYIPNEFARIGVKKIWLNQGGTTISNPEVKNI